MSKTLRNGLIAIAVLVFGGALVWTGFMFGRSTLGNGGYWHNSMMGFQDGTSFTPNAAQVPYGMMGDGMMSGYPGQGNNPYGYGMMGGNSGTGMMGSGMMGASGGSNMMGSGMMGGYASGGLNSVEPLTIDQAKNAVAGYLKRIDNPDLKIKEVMIFDNQAYAEIVEKSTGIGAMEVLVDPTTLAVYPEFGPNMMWNLKYGMMSGNGNYGMMSGGRMGGDMMEGRGQGSAQSNTLSAEMSVTPEKAVEIAQKYLDQYLAGTQVEDHADVFYGYYTLHILRDGKVIGMLSVNGYSGQVFPHTWHGDFVEMSEEE